MSVSVLLDLYLVCPSNLAVVIPATTHHTHFHWRVILTAKVSFNNFKAKFFIH